MNNSKMAYQAVQHHEPGQMSLADMMTLVCFSVVISVLIVVSITAIIILRNRIKYRGRKRQNEYYHLRSHYACAWCSSDLLQHDVDDTGFPPNVYCDNCGEYTDIETGKPTTLPNKH